MEVQRCAETDAGQHRPDRLGGLRAGLYTGQGRKGATLKGRARDLDDIDEAMQWGPLTFTWQLLGETSEVKNTEADEGVISVLEKTGKVPIGTIAKTIGKDFSNTRRRLLALWTKGKVRKEVIGEKVYYYLPQKSDEK